MTRCFWRKRDITMRIAYLTTDEVNRAWAEELADRTAHTLTLSLGPPDQQVDAVVYDLDYLPIDVREHVLTTLQARRPALPVAVHSYNLEDECIEALQHNGVLAYRRLQSKVFR